LEQVSKAWASGVDIGVRGGLRISIKEPVNLENN
jgi:hypothetical protein